MDRETWIVTPLVQSPPVALHQTILDKVMYGSQTAMENYTTKLPADVNPKGGLELCTYWVSRALTTFINISSHHLVNVICNFMWSDTAWLSCSRS